MALSLLDTETGQGSGVTALSSPDTPALVKAEKISHRRRSGQRAPAGWPAPDSDSTVISKPAPDCCMRASSTTWSPSRCSLSEASGEDSGAQQGRSGLRGSSDERRRYGEASVGG